MSNIIKKCAYCTCMATHGLIYDTPLVCHRCIKKYLTEHGTHVKPVEEVCMCGDDKPTYKLQDATYFTHCKLCKTDNMILRTDKTKAGTCIIANCRNRRSYGSIFGERKYCKEHGLALGCKLWYDNCQCGNSDRPNYKLKNDEYYSYCDNCNVPNTVERMHFKKGLCSDEECLNIGTYKDNIGRYCLTHKPDTAKYNDTHIKCLHDGCDKRAVYGLQNEDKTHCPKHADKSTMIDLVSNKCKTCIKKIASFNYEGIRAGYCNDCKLPDMINVKSAKCIVCKTKQPKYGSDGKSTHCFGCKQPDMLPIYHTVRTEIPVAIGRNCQAYIDDKRCPTRASYGLTDDVRPSYCASHADKDIHIRIGTLKCAYDLCETTPSFRDDDNNIWCATHKTDTAISIDCRKCQHEGCDTRPTFSDVDNATEGAKWCKIHRPENYASASKTCIHSGCKVQPHYNYPDQTTGIYCASHRTDKSMINIYLLTCRIEGCPVKANKNYDNYCTQCFMRTFPNDDRSKTVQTKTKELKVKEFIENNYIKFIHDQPLFTPDCDCSIRRRIDFRRLINNTMLCIEVDEFEHKRYSKQDEIARYNDAYMGFAGKWIFIRFNPDPYTLHKVKQNPSIDTRLIQLKHEIDKQRLRIDDELNTELIEVVYLFYSE